jgi:hypothetical protein
MMVSVCAMHCLVVQVAPAWRQQSDKLKDFGYFDPLYIT